MKLHSVIAGKVRPPRRLIQASEVLDGGQPSSKGLHFIYHKQQKRKSRHFIPENQILAPSCWVVGLSQLCVFLKSSRIVLRCCQAKYLNQNIKTSRVIHTIHVSFLFFTREHGGRDPPEVQTAVKAAVKGNGEMCRNKSAQSTVTDKSLLEVLLWSLESWARSLHAWLQKSVLAERKGPLRRRQRRVTVKPSTETNANGILFSEVSHTAHSEEEEEAPPSPNPALKNAAHPQQRLYAQKYHRRTVIFIYICIWGDERGGRWRLNSSNSSRTSAQREGSSERYHGNLRASESEGSPAWKRGRWMVLDADGKPHWRTQRSP